ncbi:hypothetical protein ACQPXT_34335 [Streptomyces sp. CA-100214]
MSGTPNCHDPRNAAMIPSTITHAVAARTGETSNVAFVTKAIAEADQHDAAVRTFLDRHSEQVLARATAADAELAAGTGPGPPHGIPLGIEDITTTADGVPDAPSFCSTGSKGRVDTPAVGWRCAGAE